MEQDDGKIRYQPSFYRRHSFKQSNGQSE